VLAVHLVHCRHTDAAANSALHEHVEGCQPALTASQECSLPAQQHYDSLSAPLATQQNIGSGRVYKTGYV
jgi:hypothetical protein